MDPLASSDRSSSSRFTWLPLSLGVSVLCALKCTVNSHWHLICNLQQIATEEGKCFTSLDSIILISPSLSLSLSLSLSHIFFLHRITFVARTHATQSIHCSLSLPLGQCHWLIACCTVFHHRPLPRHKLLVFFILFSTDFTHLPQLLSVEMMQSECCRSIQIVMHGWCDSMNNENAYDAIGRHPAGWGWLARWIGQSTGRRVLLLAMMMAWPVHSGCHSIHHEYLKSHCYHDIPDEHSECQPMILHQCAHDVCL